MRQQLKGFVRRHPSIFNPMWPIVYPVIGKRRCEIVSAPPSGDLWMCCDVLAHLPNADGLTTLGNFVAPDITYLLTKTRDIVTVSSDTRPRGIRYVNLRRPPFEFGKPRNRNCDFHRTGSARIPRATVARGRQSGLAMMCTNICANRRRRNARFERWKSALDCRFWCAPSVLVMSVRFL